MGKIKDLIGQKFGKLLVLEITNERRNRQVVWKCQCDCGNISYVVGQALRSGHTQSCGCSWKESKAEDLTGKQYGWLTVIERDYEQKSASRSAFWKCQCECGNYRTVSASDLRTGQVTKCYNCTFANIQHPKGTPGPIKDHTNEHFGRLTAIKPLDKRTAGKVVWLCKCECGTYCEASSNQLVSGIKQSCGCLKHSSIGELKIEELLIKNNIPFCKQPTLPEVKDKIALRYDFGILNDNNQIARLIEFDGIQHYQAIDWFGGTEEYVEQKKRDRIKNLGAANLNIPLVRIPYIKRDDITLNDILGDEFLVKL